MAPKLFITGTTGFIGGDFLYLVSEKHPDWELTCLVRNPDKGAKVAAVYPKVRLVYGDLSSSELIEDEASKADIVYHFANCDDIPSAQAISKGLARRQKSIPDGNPGYWIHTCGTSILSVQTRDMNAYGEELDKVYNDWDGISELTSLPHHAPHRDVDEIVLASFTNSPSPIRTAIVCPPCIYGKGRGPDNQRSVQIPRSTLGMLKMGQGFHIGKGESIWHQVHVQDLSKLYLLLGEAAVSSPPDGAPATWNEQGYYLAENNHPFKWCEVAQQITNEAYQKRYLRSKEIRAIPIEEAVEMFGNSAKSFGTNSRGVAIRASKLLGWKPTMPLLKDTIADSVELEAKSLELSLGHKDVVAAEAQ